MLSLVSYYMRLMVYEVFVELPRAHELLVYCEPYHDILTAT